MKTLFMILLFIIPALANDDFIIVEQSDRQMVIKNAIECPADVALIKETALNGFEYAADKIPGGFNGYIYIMVMVADSPYLPVFAANADDVRSMRPDFWDKVDGQVFKKNMVIDI